MLLLPSSLPCVSVVWGCLVYRSPLPSIPPPLPPSLPSWVLHCAVRVSSMLCPPSSEVMESPPPPRCALVPGLLVGWLLVFGLLGWLLCWLAVG